MTPSRRVRVLYLLPSSCQGAHARSVKNGRQCKEGEDRRSSEKSTCYLHTWAIYCLSYQQQYILTYTLAFISCENRFYWLQNRPETEVATGLEFQTACQVSNVLTICRLLYVFLSFCAQFRAPLFLLS